MSEQEKQKSSFMEELNQWTEDNIIAVLLPNLEEEQRDPKFKLDESWQIAIDDVKKAIRAKVLESYRNGQAAGPRQPIPPRRSFQR